MNHMRSSHLRNDHEEDFVKKVQGEEAEVKVKKKTIHKCAKCGERYRKLPTLNLHMREDHPEVGENKVDQDQSVKTHVKHDYAKFREIESKEDGLENYEEVTVSEKECDENNMDHKVDMEPYEPKGVNGGVERDDRETLWQDSEDENKYGTVVIAVSENEDEIKSKTEIDFSGSEDEDKYKNQDIVVSEEANMELKVDSDTIELEDTKEAMKVSFVSMVTCIECGKEVSSMKKLKIHKRNMHLADTNNMGHYDWRPYISESEDGKPKCKKCEKEYSCVGNLRGHVKYVHLKKEPRIRPQEPEDERICIICERIFDKTINMKLHLVKHTKIYKNLNIETKISRSVDRRSATCLECGKWDGRSNNIKQHIAQVHYALHKIIDFNNKENFDFSEGGTALKKTGRIAKKKEIKTGVFRCFVCENIFTEKLALMNHVKRSH